VAHIHYVLFGGSIFSIFAAVYYWFPKMFGRMMNRTLGYIHFFPTFIFFNCTFFPMHILGVGGHMRRIANPTQYEFLKPLQPINARTQALPMTPAPATPREASRRRAADFLMLTQPRLVSLVLVTTLVGFYLGSAPGSAAGGRVDFGLLLATIVGTGLAASGAQ